MDLDKAYWDIRYDNLLTGWDIGTISAPLRAYFDQLSDKSLTILIPGAGNGHEARYLHELGFEQVIVLDISDRAVSNFQKEVPHFPKSHVICGDFFHHQGQYDLIIEQTFFCALDPELRPPYVQKSAQLLKPAGKLVGLLWGVPMNLDQPPFGGSAEEYERLFNPYFQLSQLEPCYNSIPPRANRELFINFTKKT